MSKQTIMISLSFLFLLSLPISQGFLLQPAPGHQWYVDANNISGPWNGDSSHPFLHIQTAIDHADNGDIINVFDGIYHESPIIDKAITLQSIESTQVIIDGEYADSIMHIIHPNVNVNGFTLRNSSGAQKSCGIRIKAADCIISNCQFYRTKSGIYIENEQDILISHCFFHTNGDGVALINTDHIELQTNDFTHNGLGINSDHSTNIIINDCYATINGIGIFLNDSKQITITETASFNNNDNQGGIFLNNCEDILIKNSRVEHNGFGIKPFDSNQIRIKKSTLQHNTHVGVFAERSKDIFINKSLFTDNFRYSINAGNSELSIHHSNIYSSLVGLYSEGSTIEATHNYWGSPFGPVFFEHEEIARIRQKSSSIHLWPISAEKNIAGATWEIDPSRCSIPSELYLHQIIKVTGKDSDNDGTTDLWEEEYGYDAFTYDDHQHLDPDEDGLSNIEECYTADWGSDPFQKDIFLEVDWMPSQTGKPNQNRLSLEDIQTMKDVFKVNNINLHVDHGALGGGESVPYQSNFTYADLRDIYWDYFLHQDLNNPRKGVFHYCIINDWGPGPGFAFIGWDDLDSFDISAQELTDNQPKIDRNILIVGGSIHELGHTLGLTVDDHPGNDNQIATWILSKQWWQYRQYKSCMNYWYTYRILGFSDGSHGRFDFNDWEHMDLSFFKNTHFDLPDQFR